MPTRQGGESEGTDGRSLARVVASEEAVLFYRICHLDLSRASVETTRLVNRGFRFLFAEVVSGRERQEGRRKKGAREREKETNKRATVHCASLMDFLADRVAGFKPSVF